MDQRLRFDRLSKRVRQLTRDVPKNGHELGQVLGLLLDDELFRHAGHASFVAYVEADLVLSVPVAYRWIDISRHFSCDTVRRHGVTKLEAGLAYARALPMRDRPDDVTAVSIPVRDASGGVVGKAFSDASSRELREATAQAKAINRGDDISSELRQRVGRLAEALPPVPKHFVRGDRVRLQQKDGRVFVSFLAIPLDKLDDVILSLRSLAADAVE